MGCGTCQGPKMWLDGPTCNGQVVTVLVSKKTVRLMSRIVEAVYLCGTHRAYAQERGLVLWEVDKVA